MLKEKRCTKCNKIKLISDFHKKKDTKDGYRNICKYCVNIYMTEYKKNHIKERSEYDKKRYEEKREKILERKKQYHIDNRDIILEKKKIYREKNENIIKEKQKRKYKEDEEYRNKIKNWKKENKNEWNSYISNYRLKNKYNQTWRSILHSTLKRLGTSKQSKTIELLGYSAIELKNHIEKLFTTKMSWDNYGEWEIDHIKPVYSFPKETDISIVCSLDNLQPLWKTTKIIDDIEYIGNRNKNKKLF